MLDDRTPMDHHDRPEDHAFRAEARAWLVAHVVGDFAAVGGRGGPGDEETGLEVRRAWERELAAGGWTCIGWPVEHGGRGATVAQQVIFNEEYVRARAPGRVNVIGEGLLGPTLIHFGTAEQQARFLPPIVAGTELWCQGYSEPDAGSDLASLATRAERSTSGDAAVWEVTGQKVWTSLAHVADWCFVLCRSEAGSTRHRGLSYLLVPMDQPGIEVRPIVQLTGTSEFNEVFFDHARTDVANVVGEPGEGWRVAMATLAFERGAGLLGHQLSFRRELDALVATARANGRSADPVARQRLAGAHVELELLRLNTLRSLAADDGAPGSPAASIAKLFWGSWHQRFGSLALDVLGPAGVAWAGAPPEPAELDAFRRTFLFSRADTIYGGSNEIQRNIIGERVLGLPREPKGASS